MSDDLYALSQFNGVGRLFPLPNLVLFPSVIQPLHIFEPRYRRMTADALDGDRLITLVLLKPGFEEDYEGRPDVFPVACLGRILADQQLENGRFNLLIRGISRVRILREVPDSNPYRSARLELLHDGPQPNAKTADRLRRQLSRAVLKQAAAKGEIVEGFRKLIQSDLSVSSLCDICCFTMDLDPAIKQELLEILDVEQRVTRVLAHLRATQKEAEQSPVHKFPPDFSEN